METKFKKMIYLLCVIILSSLFQENLARAQELLGWWKLDDGTGKTAVDSSGKGNNGTVQGDGKWVEGKIGGAMEFNGTNAFISAPHIPLDNRSFTITMWIKPNVMIGNHTFFSQGVGQDNKLLHVRLGGPNALYNTPVRGFRFAFYNNDLDTPTNLIQTNTWYNVAFVYDYENKTRSIYINGEDVAHDTGVLPYTGDTGETMLGATTEMGREYLNGVLDDIRIYGIVLTRADIRTIALSGFDTQFQSMSNAIEDAGKLINGQKAKQAIPLLEKEISKYGQFKKENPDKNISICESMACELNYLLGAAYEANGEKKNTIAEAYKKSLLLDISDKDFMLKQGTALLWLYQNTNTDYNNVVNSLLKNNSHYLKVVAVKSEAMISNKEAQNAINFLEGNIVSYTQWQKEHSFDKVVAEDMLPEIYFQLAKAKEAIKAPSKDIAEAYNNTFKPSSYNYVPQRVAALIWLVENNRTEELAQVIKSFTQEQNIEQSYKDIVSGVCKHLESEKDADGFQLLLDTLFTTAKYPSDWATFVESSITDKTSRWAKVYYASLENKPKLQLDVDRKHAEELVSGEKYKEAADLYKDMLLRSGPDDNKSELEFSLLKCLFDGGFYSEAIAKIDAFSSNNNKGTNRSRAKEAMLMKGRALIQLGETDKAVDAFSSIMVEYPEAKELPETTFFVGYCYMLQGKFKEATEAFEIVLKSYPDSTYANQAKLYLTRIKDMAN